MASGAHWAQFRRDYSGERARLVESIRQGALEGSLPIGEAALGTLACIPRERFVPWRMAPEAYEDRALPIGLGQTVSQPTMVAWMTSLLGLTGGERVLEIGTGSGYQAYALSLLLPRGHLTTIERHPYHARRARRRLKALGARNIKVVTGDGSRGYPPSAPYDRILVTAGAPSVPDALLAQLAPGGRMVLPTGARDLQELLTIDKGKSGEVVTRSEGQCVFVPLIGSEGWKEEEAL